VGALDIVSALRKYAGAFKPPRDLEQIVRVERSPLEQIDRLH
jgi:hypothetical protein